MDRIKAKRRRFNALLAVGKMTDAKPHILEGFGVQSTLQLTEKQLDAAIGRVEEIVQRKKTEVDAPVREWRHKCLRLIQKCGVDTRDWNNVNAFLLDNRIAGKHLYELSLLELTWLHRKLQNVSEKMEIQRQKELKLTTLN